MRGVPNADTVGSNPIARFGGIMENFGTYTNLEIEVGFTDNKTEDIIREINVLLEKYGYKQFCREASWENSGVYLLEKVNFLPKESF